uniref:DDE_3 domain-containing protein n=1 Tax=Caenorhabditis japonica TaxID=281687 RepID=A0A8R1I7J2_CAEJA
MILPLLIPLRAPRHLETGHLETGHLETATSRNPDISKPDISKPDISKPDISKPRHLETALTGGGWTKRESLNDVRAELNLSVCKQTVHNVITRSGTIVRQKMAKVPKMTDRHKTARLDFVKANLGTKWENRNFGGGSLMTWIGFCNGKKMELQFISTKENSISYQRTLQNSIVPFFRNRRNTHLFQQDNAAIHTSNSTMAWFSAKRIKVLQWPACSPDLDPVEDLWGLLARRVYRHGKQYNNTQDLMVALKDEWDAVSEAELKSLVSSMPNRLFEVIQKNGGETSYSFFIVFSHFISKI